MSSSGEVYSAIPLIRITRVLLRLMPNWTRSKAHFGFCLLKQFDCENFVVLCFETERYNLALFAVEYVCLRCSGIVAFDMVI
jgi:hypothetical protein